MRMIIQIAKAELRNLFFSPVAWFLILLFLVQCAYFFTSGLVLSANLQDMLVKNNPGYSGIQETGYTRLLFIGGLFSNVFRNLYLFVPLLTMGLIGREVQNGTFRLLYSSPVKLRQVVLGKYLAIMIFNLLLILIVGVFMVAGILTIKEVDYGMLLSATLGFYLLTCTYSAIGMFMSSITTHQIIAAISTFLIVFSLNFVGGLWQQYDFVRDLTFFLHLPGRVQKMLYGLITTKDLIYFQVIVAAFIGFTILHLRSAREYKPWYIHFMRYSVVVSIALMIGYISSRPALTKYWDTTAQDIMTIHEKTQGIIREMGDEPLEVTLYSNLLGPGGSNGFPEARNAYLTNVWEKIVRFKPDIRFNYVYYYDHDSTLMGNALYRPYPGKSLEYIANKIAMIREVDTADFLKPLQIRKMIDLRPENLRLVMQLKYKGRTEFLRTFDDPQFWPEELQIAAAFKRLVNDTLPKVAFATGHYERHIYKTGEREFANHTSNKLVRKSLINLGFETDTIALDRDNIPADITALVLADPKSELSPVCQEKINEYLRKGGNMLVMGEPEKQHIVNPVLKQLGVSLMDGMLISQSKSERQDMQWPHLTDAFVSITQDPSSTAFVKAPEQDVHLYMPRVAAIDYSDTAGFINTPLLMTTAGKSWVKKGKLNVDSAHVEYNEKERDIQSFFASLSGKQPSSGSEDIAGKQHVHDENGAFVTLLALNRMTGNKEQRVVVAGDADFISNDRKKQHDHGVLLYSWLARGAYPVYIPRPLPPDKFLTISGEKAVQLELFFVWILPALVLLAATVLLIRRKRK